jgi:acetoacetyl-CoA synthetase
MSAPLWQPSRDRIESANLTAFMARVEKDWGVSCRDYAELYDFSIAEIEKFWSSVWDFCGVIAEHRGEVVLEHPDRMPGARFFPDARLNFAENLLRRRGSGDSMVFWGEDRVTYRVSCGGLYGAVSRLVQALEAIGVREGDRVAGFMPNMPETVIAMLATASLGAVWSSCSPDFGVQGGRACSTASARSSPRCCSARTATTTPARPTIRSAASRSLRPDCRAWSGSSSCPT